MGVSVAVLLGAIPNLDQSIAKTFRRSLGESLGVVAADDISSVDDLPFSPGVIETLSDSTASAIPLSDCHLHRHFSISGNQGLVVCHPAGLAADVFDLLGDA